MSRFDDEDTRILGIMAVLGVFGLELEEEEVGVTRADDPSLGGLFESIPVVVWSNEACLDVDSVPYAIGEEERD
jgi:hypothetical protein